MGNRRHIPPQQKELIVYVSGYLMPHRITTIMGISECAIRADDHEARRPGTNR